MIQIPESMDDILFSGRFRDLWKIDTKAFNFKFCGLNFFFHFIWQIDHINDASTIHITYTCVYFNTNRFIFLYEIIKNAVFLWISICIVIRNQFKKQFHINDVYLGLMIVKCVQNQLEIKIIRNMTKYLMA